MKILILNGPNLNLLGIREPEVYGRDTLDELNRWLESHPDAAGVALQFMQSNHEGALIDALHEQMGQVDGCVFNPGAYTHTSYALRDAIAGVDYPVVEVHLSDINNREPFRKVSVLKEVCLAQISGRGKEGYLEGIRRLMKHLGG